MMLAISDRPHMPLGETRIMETQPDRQDQSSPELIGAPISFVDKYKAGTDRNARTPATMAAQPGNSESPNPTRQVFRLKG